jgi:hypothetical protein
LKNIGGMWKLTKSVPSWLMASGPMESVTREPSALRKRKGPKMVTVLLFHEE